MNYPESKEILEQVKKADKILINCHRGPDPDSIGSALGLYKVLTDVFNKKVDVVCTENSRIMKEAGFLPNFDVIKSVDYGKFDFSVYDLFISPDSAEWQQIVDDESVSIPKIPIVVIDHHITNTGFGLINLIDAKMTSCAEMVYLLFKDWEITINKEVATLLLTGILTDTGAFQFLINPETLENSANLMRLGANKEEIIKKLFHTRTIESLKIWGEFLTRMELDKEHRFAWTAIPYSTYNKYGRPPKSSSLFATVFGSVISETDFSVIILETERNSVDVSFRTRENFDVSKIASELGGGGHKFAAATRIEGLSFDKAIEKVLDVARKYSAR